MQTSGQCDLSRTEPPIQAVYLRNRGITASLLEEPSFRRQKTCRVALHSPQPAKNSTPFFIPLRLHNCWEHRTEHKHSFGMSWRCPFRSPDNCSEQSASHKAKVALER